jgi:hypothetical protein
MITAARRGELLDATEKKLAAVADRVRRPLGGNDKIALSRVIDHHKMATYPLFTLLFVSTRW